MPPKKEKLKPLTENQSTDSEESKSPESSEIDPEDNFKELVNEAYDENCKKAKTSKEKKDPFKRLVDACERNNFRKYNQTRHDMFQAQAEFCYRDYYNDYKYASNNVVALPSCLADIEKFRRFYSNDVALAKEAISTKGNLKDIFTFQSTNDGSNNRKDIIFYKKSSKCRPQNAHRGLARKYNECAKDFNEIFDQQTAAKLCLIRIKSKKSFIDLINKLVEYVSDNGKLNKYYEYFKSIEELCYISHIADAHKERMPGVDKYFRALLRNVAKGNSTFEEIFHSAKGTYFLGREGGTHYKFYKGNIEAVTEWGKTRDGKFFPKEKRSLNNDENFNKEAINENMSDSSAIEEEIEKITTNTSNMSLKDKRKGKAIE